MDGEDTELAASTNVGEETAAVARDARTEDTALAPKTPEADTTVLADEVRTELADALAWSDTEAGPTDPAPYAQRGAARRWVVVGAAVALPLAAVLALGTVFYHEEEVPTAAAPTQRAPTAAPVPAPPAAVLDGTYRMEPDLAKQTANGAPDPQPKTSNSTFWWAFRSACRPIGCVATGTKLDVNDHQVASSPADTAELHFVDGHWQKTPVQIQVQFPYCLATDGKSVVASADTEVVTWSLEPQPDGTLRGGITDTALTNECGRQGKVFQAPAVATRTGGVPPGVSVADPATVPAAPASAPRSAGVGPVLDGTYRLDPGKQTVNGEPTTGPPIDPRSRWWAYRSLCTTSGCVATAAQVGDDNHQEPTGMAAGVLHFIDGQWRYKPSIQSLDCSPTDKTYDTDTVSWSFDPQPDGTLRGVMTSAALTNECGDQGKVFRTSFLVTRIGDVPPGVVLADPALFVAPPAAATTPPRAGG